MKTNSAQRAITAELLGTAFLLATIVGSGIMAERLADGNIAIALLANTLATSSMLVVLITIFGPVSGAHFNPAVTLAFALRREVRPAIGLAFVGAQLTGAMLGVLVAHGMFEESPLVFSTTDRSSPGLWFAEGIATFGLLMTILAALRVQPTAIPWMVGLYIAAAHWFTASTSFANPAVTIARSLTDTFSGINPGHAPAFIAAQLVGAAAAVPVIGWLFSDVSEPEG